MTLPNLSVECGPVTDRRTLEIKIPPAFTHISVLVSGGLDSALLYYLLKKIEDPTFLVEPYTITRNDGSQLYAQPIIDYVHDVLCIPRRQTNCITIPKSIDPNIEVAIGIGKLMSQVKTTHLFVGIIDTLPEHSIGYNIRKPADKFRISYPLKDLNKSHIVELIMQFNQQKLYEITHSCVRPVGRCGICNRCKERTWAFEQLSALDSGTV